MREFCLYMYVHAEQCLASRLFPPQKSGFSPVRGFATGFFSWWRCGRTSSELGISLPPAQLCVQVLFVVVVSGSGVLYCTPLFYISMLCV